MARKLEPIPGVDTFINRRIYVNQWDREFSAHREEASQEEFEEATYITPRPSQLHSRVIPAIPRVRRKLH